MVEIRTWQLAKAGRVATASLLKPRIPVELPQSSPSLAIGYTSGSCWKQLHSITLPLFVSPCLSGLCPKFCWWRRLEGSTWNSSKKSAIETTVPKGGNLVDPCWYIHALFPFPMLAGETHCFLGISSWTICLRPRKQYTHNSIFPLIPFPTWWLPQNNASASQRAGFFLDMVGPNHPF